MFPPPSGYQIDERHVIDRDLLCLPDVLIESYDIDVLQTLRPVLDALWQSADYPRSMRYR